MWLDGRGFQQFMLVAAWHAVRGSSHVRLHIKVLHEIKQRIEFHGQPGSGGVSSSTLNAAISSAC